MNFAMLKWILILAIAPLPTAVCQAQGLNSGAGMSYYNRPTVSPYLNLSIRNEYGLTSYQTLVRPMLEQQAAEQRSAVGSTKLRNRAAAIESSGSRSTSKMRAVPQTARYMNYSHFYGGTKAR
jgi:hypothetical protein